MESQPPTPQPPANQSPQSGTVPQPPDQKTVDAMLAVMQAEAAQDTQRISADKTASKGFVFRYISKLIWPFTGPALAQQGGTSRAVLVGILYLIIVLSSFLGPALF